MLERLRGLIKSRSEKPRQLLVDVSLITRVDAGTGIQRVVRAFLLNIPDLLPQNVVLVPVAGRKYLGYRQCLPPRWLDLPDDGKVGRRVKICPGDIFLGLDLAMRSLPRSARQLRRWRRKGLRINIVVYDLLPLLRPEWFMPEPRAWYARWMDFIEQNADRVLCISNAVRDDVNAHFATSRHANARNIEAAFIPLGADIRSSSPSRGLPQDFDGLCNVLRDRQVVLMVGTLEPRKGHAEALAAFEVLWRAGPASSLALVIVGRPGWGTEEIQAKLRSHAELGSRLFWFDDASDEALERLYEIAHGVLVASHAEGYGLPLIEAGWYRKPVLARDIPVFREIAGNGATYFPDGRPEPFAASINTWLGNKGAPIMTVAAISDWRQATQKLLETIDVVRRERDEAPYEPTMTGQTG